MCGIAGWAGSHGPDRSALSAMVASLKHRGPDEAGYWENAEASLGMARLSIIDVLEGHQPVYSSDGSVVAVCNGEIYNHEELAADLRRRGIVLASNSDVEVIPHLYEIYGDEFPQHLRGMFAIALFDSKTDELLLVRDRVGKKPLVYAEASGSLFFASEVRALLVGGWAGVPDLDALDHVLAFGNVPLSGGVYQGLRQVPPGHVLRFSSAGVSSHPFWSWELAPRQQSDLEAKAAALQALEEAVRLRLVSERPWGAFLSGGIDSTLVTALMAKHHVGPVKTFTVGFRDSVHDESLHAREVARYLGTDHHEIVVEPDPVTIVERLASAYDQPFADSSAIPTFLLSEFASQHVVVALAGDGGDEAFGGYVRYRAAAELQKWNGLLTIGQIGAPAVMAASRLLQRPRLARLAVALRPQPSLEARYLRIMSLTNRARRERVWSPNTSVDSARADRLFADVWAQSAGQSPINRMRAHDLAWYLPGDLLAKVDTASMAHSLEVRSPLLDQEVLAAAAGLAPRMMIRGGVEKWILRQIAYDLVPRGMIDRPKQGFSIPRAAWLRGPLRTMVGDLLLDHTARNRGWFDNGEVERLLSEHDRGVDRDMMLWPLLMIEVWARRWVDSPRPVR